MQVKEYRGIPSPLKWHGGKGGYHGKLARWIVSLMPKHTHYVEPFYGGGSVMLYKPPEGVSEVANDIHGELSQFWKVLQNPAWFKRLKRRLEATPFSEYEYKRAQRSSSDVAENAARFYIRCRQSLAGRMDGFAPLSKSRTRRRMNEQASAWLTAIEGLPAVHARLKRVAVLNRPAIDVIKSQDSPKTCFYLDPPYLHETRSTTGEYEHEMSAADHSNLLKVLSQISGRFLLSGYRSTLYDRFASKHNGTCREYEVPNCASSGRTKRVMTECVWMNYKPTKEKQ